MEGRPAELATTLSCLGGAERRGITLEIVLVGPTEPDFELPEAARWFAADGSHAAQLAAGARTARGRRGVNGCCSWSRACILIGDGMLQ